MGLVECFGWMQSRGKKQCKSLFWRIKAAMKKAMRNGGKQHVKFQYDPHSYALNFDDGFHQEMGGREREFDPAKFQDSPEFTIWVYLLWVEGHSSFKRYPHFPGAACSFC
ncbi:UNVERIFIED_CONTAM: hypothetical protein Slati_2001200 [Sesamum latifolium]|uniref:Uncharacterized protein n=1 Tax=Sesamum latifolium TaxID=2727402 RepID=A0AAW2WRT6_9LAMI